MQEQTTTAPTGPGRPAPGLDELLTATVAGTKAHMGALYLLPPDERVLLMSAVVGIPAPIANQWARIRLEDPVPAAAAVRERRLVWLAGPEDVARRFPGVALSLPYHFSVAAMPVHAGGVDWGALVLLWPEPHPAELTPHELEVLEGSTRRMGTLLRRAADHGEPLLPGSRPRILTPRRARHGDPADALAAFDYLNRLPWGACAMDMEGRVTFITPQAAALLEVEPADLLCMRPWEVLPWMGDPVFEDHYREAVLSHQPTSFTARHPSGRRLSFEFHSDQTGISVRIAPDLTAPPPAGEERSHTADSRTLRADALYNMVHLAANLTRAVTVQDVTDLVADQVMSVCDIQALALVIAENGRLRVVGERGYGPGFVDRYDGLPIDAPTGTCDALRSGDPEFYGNWEEYKQNYPDAVRYDDMSAWALLPLITSGRPFGLCLFGYDRPHIFSPDERATLTSLAGLIGQALERARLYDVKHQLAECLQASLLPSELPVVDDLEVAAHYLPATRGMDIGGDFYDLIRLDDTTVAAVIGDVQGHDMTAAALMGQVRTAIHAHATAGASPGEVLAHTNLLLIDLAPELFTSCLYVTLDLKRRRATLASAGHLPPLLHTPGSVARSVDLPPGLLLGLEPDADYPTREIPFPTGSVLALYTDGLIEEPGVDLDQGIADLAAHLTRAADLPLHILVQLLIDQAESVDHRTDDIALLLLKSPP
ncbi:SpoIIE family protein phosphatase [Nonomuraea sp. NPDC047897]|uniref:SpoIIE family protein phosphatase n=1 Tax=Nonomuraea sp. NPDC047897 TaxID=3364346 RepID=UPI00371D3ABA